MSNSSEPLFEQALRLPEKDRADLAHRLLQSLDPDGVDERYEIEWIREIELRAAEVENGTATLIDGDEVSRRLRAKFPGADSTDPALRIGDDPSTSSG